MKPKLSTYAYAVYGLVTLLCVISIGFGLLFCATQSDATTVALTTSSRDTPHEPIVEVDDQPLVVLDAMTANGLEAQAASDAASASAEQDSAQTAKGDPTAGSAANLGSAEGIPIVKDKEMSTEQRIYSSARYLAAYLALGCYEGLPGAEEIYNQLLAELNIDFTAYDDIVAEIEAVTAALENAPEIWQRYADATLAAELLPA